MGTIGLAALNEKPPAIAWESNMGLTELRRHERKPFEYTARMSFGDGSAPHPCEILDISDGGARLHVNAPNKVPDTFKLLLSSHETAFRLCEVVRRTDNEIGVRFRRRSNPSATPQPKPHPPRNMAAATPTIGFQNP
jgi:hypothetical protein